MLLSQGDEMGGGLAGSFAEIVANRVDRRPMATKEP